MAHTISRLKAAWIALGAVVAVLVVTALLAPTPSAEAPGVTLDLPAEPDRYARGRGAARTGMEAGAGADEPATDEAPAPLPRVVLGEPAPAPDAGAAPVGEVVITVGGDARPGAPATSAPRAVPPAAPVDALTKQTPRGARPAIGPDGRTPFTTYRRLVSLGEARGAAVIVSGLGLDPALTARAIALPADVSLAFAPYAKDLPGQLEAARAAGHEVMIELPMGTPGVADEALGPAGLTTARTPAANAQRLGWLLTRAPAYPMVTNYLGRGFSGDEAAMSRVMATLAPLGVAYVDDTGLAAAPARFAGVPYAAADVVIDPAAGDVATQLGALTRARPGEVTLAKLYATPEALDALAAWARELPDGAMLVPASTAVRAP